MNLVIHDLNKEEWGGIAEKYSGWNVISDQGKIRPCLGCFGCWVKEPGQCVMKDGYERMGALIHQADEVVVISRYTYGGFSSFVKNVFDRSIGWVLPYFEIVEGEMHHKKRYPEDKPLTFVFRGGAFTEEDRRRAEDYVKAVCRNLRGFIRDIRFEEDEALRDKPERKKCADWNPGRTVLLNGSLRGDQANTVKFLTRLAESLNEKAEIVNLSTYLSRPDDLVQLLLSAEKVVLGMPMYVDGIPSAVLRIMERMEAYEQKAGKKIYALVNMGLYESCQIRNLLGMVKVWSEKCGYEYSGGLAIGAGEMLGMFMSGKNKGKGPAKKVEEGIETLAKAINSSSRTEDIYADAYCFPRVLYIFAANLGWPADGKKNGLKKKELLNQL